MVKKEDNDMDKNKPTILADDFVEYEGAEESENFTNFQELMIRVEVLSEVVEKQSEILRHNNITMEEVINAPFLDEDEIYDRLEDKDG